MRQRGVDNLIDLISIKYNINSYNLKIDVHNKISTIIDYVKYTTIDRLDGILAYEIKALTTPVNKNIIFYIPIKYINENAETLAKWNFKPTEDANSIKVATEKYLQRIRVDTKYYIEIKQKTKDNIQFWEFKLIKK